MPVHLVSQAPGGDVPPPDRRGIREIIASYGADAVNARIVQLYAEGRYLAAGCIEQELQSPDPPDNQSGIDDAWLILHLATDLFDDPTDETVALAMVSVLAARFPAINRDWVTHQEDATQYRRPRESPHSKLQSPEREPSFPTPTTADGSKDTGTQHFWRQS